MDTRCVGNEPVHDITNSRLTRYSHTPQYLRTAWGDSTWSLNDSAYFPQIKTR